MRAYQPPSSRRRHFGSDNYAGICPEAWAALEAANQDHAVGYGDDDWTARAVDLVRATFETECDVFFVFNGTAANALALGSICQSHHAVICHEAAHTATDECGAPEFFSHGAKLLLASGAHAKIPPVAIRELATRRPDVHFPKVRAVSVTQATEFGTVYSPDELAAISSECRRLDLKLHMDGARFANAVASLGVAPKAITWQAGVDVLSFGGTKNGTHAGDAVVFFDRGLAREFDYRRKQGGQLASKMRFLAAPWIGMLQDGAWLRRATDANAMAVRLHDALAATPGATILHPRQANAVFVDLPAAAISALHARGWRFYVFIGNTGCRLMCSWDTTPEDVDAFVTDLRTLL
jgi:threonine aldolase